MSQGVYIVLLIHGLWGSPIHLQSAAKELERAWTGDRLSSNLDLEILIPSGFAAKLTYDGIDICAGRVAFELDSVVTRIESEARKIAGISIAGYSLGGLIARYLVGLLHGRDPSFFSKYRPISFSCIATPHLGMIRNDTFLSKIFYWIGARVLSRSGEQLYVHDIYSEDDTRPLLEVLADPSGPFVQPLKLFRRLDLFANGVNDHTVPYLTAAIETYDPFAVKEDVTVILEDEVIVKSWSKNSEGHNTQHNRSRKWSGNLPPILRYRFPLNYIVLIFSTVIVPCLACLLYDQTQAWSVPTELADALVYYSTKHNRLSFLPLALSLSLQKRITSLSRATAHVPDTPYSVERLQSLIRKVERSVETELIVESDIGMSDPLSLQDGTSGPQLSGSQIQQARWLNRLPWTKHISWFPEVSNAHAVVIVRSPIEFPVHETGLPFLRRWVSVVLSGNGLDAVDLS